MQYAMNYNKQGGAALVVGLILLVVITVLAVSGMSTATTELAMARNDQYYENAFQAAETGLETALSEGRYNTLEGSELVQYISDNEKVLTTVDFEDSTLVPDAAFSLGVGGVSAYHFIATAIAESERAPGFDTDRDAGAVHTQAFYVIGPGDPTL